MRSLFLWATLHAARCCLALSPPDPTSALPAPKSTAALRSLPAEGVMVVLRSLIRVLDRT